MLTPAQLKELRELEAKATPGPWRENLSGPDWRLITFQIRYQMYLYGQETNEEWCANTELVRALRNHAPAILADLDRLAGLEVELRMIDELADEAARAGNQMSVGRSNGLRQAAQMIRSALTHPSKEPSTMT